MIRSSHAEMLSILANNPDGLKTAQIVRIADENPKSAIADSSSAAKMIYSLRNSELLTSWIDAGKNKHKITAKGREALTVYNNAQQTKTQPAATDPIPSVSVDHRTESDTTASQDIHKTESFSAMDLDIVEKPVSLSTIIQTPALETHQLVSDDEMARAPVSFDPFKDILAELQHSQSSIDRIQNIIKLAKPAPRIQHKQEKLATLRLVQQSIGLFNGDIEDILQQIYQDLEQMESTL